MRPRHAWITAALLLATACGTPNTSSLPSAAKTFGTVAPATAPTSEHIPTRLPVESAATTPATTPEPAVDSIIVDDAELIADAVARLETVTAPAATQPASTPATTTPATTTPATTTPATTTPATEALHTTTNTGAITATATETAARLNPPTNTHTLTTSNHPDTHTINTNHRDTPNQWQTAIHACDSLILINGTIPGPAHLVTCHHPGISTIGYGDTITITGNTGTTHWAYHHTIRVTPGDPLPNLNQHLLIQTTLNDGTTAIIQLTPTNTPTPQTTTTTPPTTPPTTSSVDRYNGYRINIPAAGINLPINGTVIHRSHQWQQAIDACTGAVLINGTPTAAAHLAAHRTGCGPNGFSGVEQLGPGNTVTITGPTSTRTWTYSHTTLDWAGNPMVPLNGHLILQTSKSGGQVYLVYFKPA